MDKFIIGRVFMLLKTVHTKAYIGLFLDSKSGVPVRVDNSLEHELITKAKKVLALCHKGKKVIFPDVLAIESELIKLLYP